MGFAILTPFVFFVELAVTMGIHALLSLLFSSCRRLPFEVKNYRRCFAALFMFSYSQFSAVCFQYLNCENIVGTCVYSCMFKSV